VGELNTDWNFEGVDTPTDSTLLGPTPLHLPYYEHLIARLGSANWRDSFDLTDFSGVCLEVGAGELVKVTLLEGPQIVTFFPFNRQDPDEHYWHQSNVREGFFLSRFTRLWGSMARYRPLLTVVANTVSTAGGDATEGFHHPILAGLGTSREWEADGGDPNVATTWVQFAALLAKREIDTYHLTENLNLFQKVAINVQAQRFEMIPSDALAGDSITFFAEIDLCVLFALSPYIDGSLSARELKSPAPRAVRITISDQLAEPLPWPYPGIPYPDLTLYLDENGVRSDTPQCTPGIPNPPALPVPVMNELDGPPTLQ
jgi:uncharacterized protein YcgI (DUF1989 family)